jgi:hypothetical protein
VVQHVLNSLIDGRTDCPQLRLQIDELDGHKPNVSRKKNAAAPHPKSPRGAMIWED